MSIIYPSGESMKTQDFTKLKLADLKSNAINHTLAVLTILSIISLTLEVFRAQEIGLPLSINNSTITIILLIMVTVGIIYICNILCGNLKKSIQIAKDQKSEYQKLNSEYLKLNHEELRKQIETAEESARFKQQFLANMSHEIRTPLTGIMGMVDILEKSDLAPQHREYVSILKQSGESLREIINQVLDFSKIEAGKITLSKQNFPTDNLFKKAEKSFKSICRKNIGFSMQKDPRVPEYIVADESRIMQIINNLITNSIKFTHSGSVTVRSELLSYDSGSDTCKIRFSVTDTGVGIAPDKQKLLFTPFTQISGNGSSEFDGTGLGLSICKELSKLHGGEIGLTSKPCTGSTFWFTILAEKGQPILPEEKNILPTKLTHNPLHILLAEDKKINQLVLKLLFTSMGHTLTIAENGKEAIGLFEKDKYDLILMDIQMPVMDGITATRLLKERHNNLPPIIGLSANAFEGDREKYMNQGFDEYLTKPLEKEDFYNALRSVFIIDRMAG